MRTFDQIKAIRAGLLAEGEALLDAADEAGRALNAQEQARFEELTAKVERLNEELDAISPGPRIPRGQPGDMEHLSEEVLPLGQSRRPIAVFHPGAKLQAFADNAKGHEAAYRSGQWLRAALLGEAKALNWCNAHGLAVDVRAAHSAGDNAKGGVLVPDELSRTIIRLVDEYGVFRRNTRVVPMSSDTLNMPRRTGGLTAHYVGEGVEGTESDTAWDNLSLVAKK